MFIARRHVPLSESRIMRIKGLHGTREPLFLAPEGRHVYSTAACALCLNRGLCGLEGLHGTREPLFLAPEGRHVYSTAAGSPQRGDMFIARRHVHFV